MTQVCAAVCYAKKVVNHRRTAAIRYNENLQLLKQGAMLSLASMPANALLRIHVSGDFFSRQYIEQWVRELAARPDITAWAYTRSWRVAKLAKLLHQLAALPNMTLLLSADRESGLPGKVWCECRVAWMAINDTDQPPAPVHVAFRVKHHRPMATLKRMNGLVCPKESGAPGAEHVTCSSCKWCYRSIANYSAVYRKATV